MKTSSKKFALILGPAVFLLTVLLPLNVFSFEARAAIGCVLWMCCWWITVPVGVAVTALLPIAINAIFGIIPMGDVINNYSSEVVVLLLGAELISISWGETGVDKRLSLKVLCLIGPSATGQIVAWFLLSAALSAFLPKSVVCAIIVPIAAAMLKFLLPGDIMEHKISPIILASIVWGAGIGGIGTPHCGAMNLIAVEYLEDAIGHEFLYLDWIVRLVPFLVVLAVLDLGYILLIRPKGLQLHGTKEYFRNMYKQLPKMNADEAWSLGLLIAATVLSFTRELYAGYLPMLKPAYAFLICGILTFIVPKKDGTPLLTWGSAEKKIGWNLLFLFAGGLAAGKLISESGAAESLALSLTTMNLDGGFATIFLIVSFTVLLAEVTSNTAAAAIALPIVKSITQVLDINPVPYIFIASAAFNVAYMLPTSIRAIPCGYGLAPSYLFKNGVVMTVLSILAISAMGYLALPLLSLS